MEHYVDLEMPTLVEIKETDSGHNLVTNLSNKGVPYDLTDCEVKLYAVKPDGTTVFANCTVNEPLHGGIIIPVTSQMTLGLGKVKCEVVVYGYDGKKIAFRTFTVLISERLNDEDAVLSSNEFSALTDKIIEVQEWKDGLEANLNFPHSHTNSSVLSGFSEQGGVLQYKGNAIGSGGGNLTDYYTKTQTDTLLAGKAPISHTHEASKIIFSDGESLQYKFDSGKLGSGDGGGGGPTTVPVTGVTLNKSTFALDEGTTETLTATIVPSDATNKNVTWSSTATSVATVSSNGVVSAVKAGNAVIKATTGDGGFIASANLLVKQPVVVTNDRQVFVMMGQSNMVGRGAGSSSYQVSAGKAYMYNHQTGTIVDGVVEPIPGANSEGTSTSVSPVVSLTKKYTDLTSGKVPVINKCCKGNMYIVEMNEGSTMYNLTVQSTNALKTKLASDGKVVTDVYGFWLQGESDAFGNMSKTEYKTKLTTMFENLKRDCGITKLFILRVAYDLNNTQLNNSTQTIMRAQKELCLERNDFIMISNINAEFSKTTVDGKFTQATMASDGVHYTAYGYDIVGAQAGENLASYINTGSKPVLVENVPELDMEQQPDTMVEYRYDFTKALTAEAGGKDFSVTGTNYTLDASGVRITNPGNTTISLAEPIVLDTNKNWVVEFEASIDSGTPATASVGVPLGNRTGGIKDCIWFGIHAANTLSTVNTAGAYTSIPITTDYIGLTKTYKLVYVKATGLVYLVLSGKTLPGSMAFTGTMSLKYLCCGYDNTTTYNFKGAIKNLSIRYDINEKIELPASQPEVLADFVFNSGGIVNNNTAANALNVVTGRESGHSFVATGMDLKGGTSSGFLFKNPITLDTNTKWVVQYRAQWRENNDTMGTGFSTSDGMLLCDESTYDWIYGGMYRSGAGGNITKTKAFFEQMRLFTVTHDPSRAKPLQIKIDGTLEWEGTTSSNWSIKRFGAGYNTMKLGFGGIVNYLKIAVNTTDETVPPTV